MKKTWLFWLSLIGGSLSAQNSNQLSLPEYLDWVRTNHPIVKQINLLPELAQADLTMARGSFDPVLSGGIQTKEFQDKTYYTYTNALLKAPIWSGIELKAGFENSAGTYINPELTTPEEGLVYAGISIPVGRGLVLDERRTAIQLASLSVEISEAERLKLANKVMSDAAKTWWMWWEAWQRQQLLQESVEIAQFRLEGIRQSIANGDKPAIDSVEARVEILKRMTELGDGSIELQNATAFASAYLWDDEGQEIILNTRIEPILKGNPYDLPSEAESAAWLPWSLEFHPEIRKLNLKQAQNERERIWAKQNLLPEVRVEFFPLSTAPPVLSELNIGNYKAGLSVYMPLFLRKERGKLESLKIKQNQIRLDIQNSSRQIDARVNASYQQVTKLDSLIDLQEQLSEGSKTMRDAESKLFQNGESSLFLVNRRERYWVEARIKLVSYQAKMGKSLVGYYYETGKDLTEF